MKPVSWPKLVRYVGGASISVGGFMIPWCLGMGLSAEKSAEIAAICAGGVLVAGVVLYLVKPYEVPKDDEEVR